MKTQDTISNFKAIAEKFVNTIKEEMTDIQQKWAPAEDEASRRFEELKLKFHNSLNEIDKELASFKTAQVQHLEELKRHIDELKVQLNLGKAEGLEAFETQMKKITTAWNILKMKLEQHPEYVVMKNEIKDDFLSWKIKLDMMKIQFSLGKMELRDNWSSISSELGKDVEHLGKAVEAGAGIAGEKLNQMEDELKVFFDKYLKKK